MDTICADGVTLVDEYTNVVWNNAVTLLRGLANAEKM